MSRTTPSTWTLDDSGWTLHASRTADGRESFSVESPWGLVVRGLHSAEAARRVARRLANGFDGPTPRAPASGTSPFTFNRQGDAA